MSSSPKEAEGTTILSIPPKTSIKKRKQRRSKTCFSAKRKGKKRKQVSIFQPSSSDTSFTTGTTFPSSEEPSLSPNNIITPKNSPLQTLPDWDDEDGDELAAILVKFFDNQQELKAESYDQEALDKIKEIEDMLIYHTFPSPPMFPLDLQNLPLFPLLKNPFTLEGPTNLFLEKDELELYIHSVGGRPFSSTDFDDLKMSDFASLAQFESLTI